jgi:glycosyltransferase involved in cell wall biosynthesis
VNRICINGKFFSQRITGTQRYARELVNQFDRLLSENSTSRLEMELLLPPGAHSVPCYKNLRVRTVGGASGVIWEQIELPRHCAGEILFTPCGGAPICHRRNVVTIHDAAVIAAPNGYAFAYRNWYKNICRFMAHTAEHIFTNSNFSRSEIAKWYGASLSKVSVTYLGSDHFSRLQSDSSALRRFGIAGKYILAVSSLSPNKNFHRVVAASRVLGKTGKPLVIAGGSDSKIFKNKLKVPDSVHVLGYVGDAELKALYENASCFVFASVYEGFGLPPMEAMSTGCPVVVSRAGALPEIFAKAGVFCDPYDSEEIAAAIERATTNPPLTPAQSKTFAQHFSWEKCARETLEVLKNL